MIPAHDRVAAKVTIGGPGHQGESCWEFTGTKTPGGYGRVGTVGKKTDYVHRVMYAAHVGPIPQGFDIDHLCRNRACCNPAHLEAVTRRENVRRGEGGAHTRNKTHCPQGHAYDEANTYVYDNRRYCRACHKAHAARHNAKRRSI